MQIQNIYRGNWQYAVNVSTDKPPCNWQDFEWSSCKQLEEILFIEEDEYGTITRETDGRIYEITLLPEVCEDGTPLYRMGVDNSEDAEEGCGELTWSVRRITRMKGRVMAINRNDFHSYGISYSYSCRLSINVAFLFSYLREYVHTNHL